MTKRTSRRATRHRGHRKPLLAVSSAQRSWLWGLAWFALALLTLVGLFSTRNGLLISLWQRLLRRGLGWGSYLIPVVFAALGVWMIARGTARPLPLPWARIVGGVLLFFTGLTIAHLLVRQPESAAAAGLGGGYLGLWLSTALLRALGGAGSIVVVMVLLIIGLTLAARISWADALAGVASVCHLLGEKWRRWRASRRERRPPPPAPITGPPRVNTPPAPPAPEGVRPGPAMPLAPRLQPAPAVVAPSLPIAPSPSVASGPWVLPRISEILAESEEKQMSLSDIRERARIIEETCRSLGVPVTVVEVNPGPVVTQFGLEPGYIERRDRQGRVKRVKVKVSRIAALANDLALALAASPIRIEAPVPGKGIVGLEIPNSESSLVSLRGVMESEQFAAVDSPLALALGRDVSGAAVVDDLATLPHLLIAGATGSGKSVCINALVACLLCRNTPDALKLVMIDPKRVELSNYNGIPHLLAPVVVEMDRVVGVLQWITREMDRRYRQFAKVGARNIQSYNELAAARGEERLPYIVVFIDELADLMMIAPDEAERAICRIAQMARATGIHLVIATQRPSVDVLTGLIKANFPARLSFAVSSQVDSRVILDVPGAEKLLGRGDALYMAPDSPKLERIQGCYVSDAELARLVAFWKDQAAQHGGRTAVGELAGAPAASGPVVQRPLWPELVAAPEASAPDGEDPLLPEAIALVTKEQRASVSFLQRRLRIGYTRAARLIDLLEERGIIGGATGNGKAREVLRREDEPPAALEDQGED